MFIPWEWSGINKCQAVLGNMETLIIKFFFLMNSQSSWEDRLVNRFFTHLCGKTKEVHSSSWMEMLTKASPRKWQWYDFLLGKEKKKSQQWKYQEGTWSRGLKGDVRKSAHGMVCCARWWRRRDPEKIHVHMTRKALMTGLYFLHNSKWVQKAHFQMALCWCTEGDLGAVAASLLT